MRNCGDQLERLRPDWVDIISADRGDYSRQVVGYIYRRNNGQADGSAEFYTTDEVAHWSPIPDPLAQWRGMSWLTPVVREVNADSAMTTHKRAFFDNAATPNMIIKYAQKLNDDAIEKLSAQWQATHGGPRNGWKTAVLDNGADPTIIGHSFEQMNFATVQAAGENRIAAAAGVPGIVVGLKEGLQAATYSNYEQAMRRFADLTMRPLWRSATAALATLISVPEGTRLWYDTAGIAALRQGEMERAQTFKEKAFTATELIRGGYDPTRWHPPLMPVTSPCCNTRARSPPRSIQRARRPRREAQHDRIRSELPARGHHDPFRRRWPHGGGVCRGV